MSRKDKNYSIAVWVCSEDGMQIPGKGLYLNTKKFGKKIERMRYNPRLRRRTKQYTRLEKSGSLGLARNK